MRALADARRRSAHVSSFEDSAMPFRRGTHVDSFSVFTSDECARSQIKRESTYQQSAARLAVVAVDSVP